MVKDSSVMYGILTVLWVEYFWELFLSVRQYRKCKQTDNIPRELESVMTRQTFSLSKAYAMDKYRFEFLEDAASITISTAFIYYGFLAKLWNYAESISYFKTECAISCIWMSLLTTIATIIELPFNMYYIFVIEEKYGFNRQSAPGFLRDTLRYFAVSQVGSVPINCATVLIVKYGGKYFFVWLWVFIILMLIAFLSTKPRIGPNVDNFTPLPEGELRNQIEALATQLNFPLTQLYVVKVSEKTTHGNAYFYGMYDEIYIVIYDTLLMRPENGGCTNDQILAIISHELGHWHYSHVMKMQVLVQFNIFMTFMIFASLFQMPVLYRAIGFADSQPVLVGLLILTDYVMMPYNNLMMYLMNCLSRHFETEADEFAVSLGKGDALISALIQIHKGNLEFPVYDPMYSAWHHSHPSLLSRVEHIQMSKRARS